MLKFYKICFCLIFQIGYTFHLSGQYQFANCQMESILFSENCETEFRLTNHIIPINGTVMDSFDIHISVDLWDDGIIDYDFISDPLQETSGQIILTSKVSSLDEIDLPIPEMILYSCNKHRVYWSAISDSGDTLNCVQDYSSIIDFELLSGDTIEHIYQGTIWVYLDDIDFSNVLFSNVVNQCDYEPTFYFKDDVKVTPTQGLYDYDCDPELFRNITYHTVYFEFEDACNGSVDSLVLKIYDQYTDYFGNVIQGACSTLQDNTIGGLEVISENCELELTTNFINSCNTFLIANLDDFFSGLNKFDFSKSDSSIRGLTARDLLILRKQILSGDTVSSGFSFAADYNNNGSITTLDQALLLKTIMLESTFNFSVPWMFELDYASSDLFYPSSSINEFIMSTDYLATAQIDDDFKFSGYKKGDLDGSYYNTIYDTSPAYCNANFYDSIEVQLDDRMILKDEIFTIPIMLNEDLEIVGLHFGLSSNLVTDINVNAGILEISDNFYNAVDSNFIAIWMSNDLNTESYKKGEILFTLTMTALSDFSLPELFKDTPDFPREIYVNDDFQALSLKMSDVGLSSIDNLPEIDFIIYPNPFKQKLFLDWGSNPALDNFVLDIIDVNGKVIYSDQNKRIVPHQRLSINTDVFISESIYFLRFTSAGRSTFKKIVRIK